MNLDEFNGPYPSKYEAFLCGRIIYRLFLEEVGIPIPKGFEPSLGFGKNNEVKIVFKNKGLYIPFNCLKEIIVLNTRLGVFDMNSEMAYNVLMKWTEREHPELLEVNE